MTPNPVAVIRGYVDDEIPFEDDRVQQLVRAKWLTKNGHLTVMGAKRYAFGWGTRDRPEPFTDNRTPEQVVKDTITETVLPNAQAAVRIAMRKMGNR